MVFALFLDQHFHVIVQQAILEIHAKRASVNKFLEIPFLPDRIMVLLKNVAIMEIVQLSVTQNMPVHVTKVILAMIVNLGHVMQSTVSMVASNNNLGSFAIVSVL